MNRGLIYLLVLLVPYLSFVATMEVTCTRQKRKCIDHAVCLNRTCLCPKNQHGDGLLSCANDDEDICLVRADPHILTYGLAKGNIPIPCRYRLAHFNVPLEGKAADFGCTFEIFGFNLISQSGKYFAAGVEIALKIGSFGALPSFAAEFIKFEINHAGVVASDGGSTEWGKAFHSTQKTVTISCEFEVDENFAIFNVPQCGTKVRFRPYRESDEPGVQVRMPGIAIISPKRSIFGPDSHYPNYLCGTPSDTHTLFKDRGIELGINNSHAAILHDVLTQGFEIGHDLIIQDLTKLLLSHSAECSRVIDAFRGCSVDERPRAVKVCMKILSKRRMIRCLRMDVLETFIYCLNAFCNSPTNCDQLVFMFNWAMRKDPISCRAPRKIRRNVNCPGL